MMKVVFMGTPEFAVASLDALLKNNINVVGVITAPDKPAGRGQVLSESAVKKFAVANGLKVLQPVSLKDEDFIRELKTLEADLQIVVAFRMLPEKVWNMPAQGTYNLHASLLPAYRGAAPINWAIINGDSESGVTTFKLQHAIDTGNILFQEKINIPAGYTAGQLHDKLMEVGAPLVVKTVRAIEESVRKKTALQFVAQDEKKVSHAPKIFKDDCRINWKENAEDICNRVLGLSPYPTAFANLHDSIGSKTIKIFYAEPIVRSAGKLAGTIDTDGKSYLNVACGSGSLRLIEVQLEGKKRMKIEEFLRGWKSGADVRFE